jgi:hypothetical protein
VFHSDRLKLVPRLKSSVAGNRLPAQQRFRGAIRFHLISFIAYSVPQFMADCEIQEFVDGHMPESTKLDTAVLRHPPPELLR